jgi:RNA polymerase sigma-70 factor (ECF subfamily)
MTRNANPEDPDLQVVRLTEPFDAFFHREYPRMVGLAYAISGSRWAAEELAQEACLRAFKSWPSISSYDKPGAWLRRVTINLSNSFVRRRVNELKALERYAVGRVEPVDPHPDDDADFWSAVVSLPRRQRAVVVLRYVDDLATTDIADVLEISESSVRTHLQRGREALEAYLEGRAGK